ncbi:protein LITTLE ZIPPER 2 [Mangifera indica]|uniref:protein LITTLE ZIPPER 2 n=1 Tax=Mangifera indica TaxID=29780 RepID=UPI001CF9CB3A|nr:protein LITTLE ZIPPER 2 [Mangifera indica]
MCINSADLSSLMTTTTSTLLASRYGRPLKRCNLRVRRLNRRRRRRASKLDAKRKEKMGVRAEMELMNLKLYRENQIIIKQNEKLKKKALLLRQENQALLSQLQTKFASQPPSSLILLQHDD